MVAIGVLPSVLPSNPYMHIPDGYLSPATALIMFFLVLPFWARGARSLRQKMTPRNAPLIALFAAFSFVIMMFNVPLPGGTTGHAVGGALAAIILGPDIAVVAISVALVIQAFFFGDGGILALGANCFNMAVVLPFVSYTVYRAIAGKASAASRRRVWGAALGGYAGLTAAAFSAGALFGIQPALFHTAGGAPLYAPYPLGVAIPAMVIPHMLVASVIEAVLAAAVVAYLQRADRSILVMATRPTFDAPAGVFGRLFGLWAALVVLVVATPLGLLAPGTAWGEWSSAELARMGLGFVPQGMARLAGLWGAPMAGYDVRTLGNANIGYVLSALLGVALIALVIWLLNLVLSAPGPAPGGREREQSPLTRTPGPKTRRGTSHAHVLRHTVANIGEALEQSLFAERIARQPGLLQSLDPRIKLLTTLAFLLATSFSHNLLVIAALYLVTLVLARLSAVPLGFFLKRVWLLMPFFTGIIAIPALFLVPGPSFVQMPLGLTITRTGLVAALFLLLRVGTSVSAAALLVLTTSWNSVLKSLAVLRLPVVFVVILGMAYRYIYLLLRLAGDMFLSRQSRVVGRLSSGDERHIIAANTGVLLSRSLMLSEDVYLAMQSRGLRGVPRTSDTFAMSSRDWLYGLASAFVLASAVWLGR